MANDKTPPRGTPFVVPPAPRQLPTIASVYNLLAGVAGQIGGARTDLEIIKERVEALEKAAQPAPEIITIPELPKPDELARTSSTPPPPPSLSMRAGAATVKGGKSITKYLVISAGVLAWVAQGVTWYAKQKPEYGPIAEALSTVAAFLSGRTP